MAPTRHFTVRIALSARQQSMSVQSPTMADAVSSSLKAQRTLSHQSSNTVFSLPGSHRHSRRLSAFSSYPRHKLAAPPIHAGRFLESLLQQLASCGSSVLHRLCCFSVHSSWCSAIRDLLEIRPRILSWPTLSPVFCHDCCQRRLLSTYFTSSVLRRCCSRYPRLSTSCQSCSFSYLHCSLEP